MLVQEAGLAIGWPLGLDNDTTGWPLGLRLRLAQEDLQWPREPHMSRTNSNTSDSSSLDTMSTRSFFQDRSISLGTLIGLPILPADYNHATANRLPQIRRDDVNYHRAFPPTTPIASTTSANSPARRPNTPNTPLIPGNPSRKLPPSDQPQKSNTAWALLSAMTCSRVPADIDDPVNQSAIQSSHFPHLQNHAQNCQNVNSLGEQSNNPSTLSMSTLPMQSLHSPVRKLYDNITFVEDAEEEGSEGEQSSCHTATTGSNGSQSFKEWNPLFASSSLATADDEEEENCFKKMKLSAAEIVMADEKRERLVEQVHPRLTTRRSLYDFLSERKAGERLVTSAMINCRPSSRRLEMKNKAISLFVTRMVCCRATPTRGSSAHLFLKPELINYLSD